MHLIPLSDGRPGLRSTLHCQVRAPSPDTTLPLPSEGRGTKGQGSPSSIQHPASSIQNPAILDFISSDATLDHYGEIISPAGWQLATYLRNPVFQNAHQYGDILFTLGKALITEVRRGDGPVPACAAGGSHTASSPLPSDGRGTEGEGPSYLFQRIQFAVDANPMAKIAYALYSGGFLNAVSVGFIPIKWEDGPVAQASTPASDAGVSPAFSPLPSDGRGAGGIGANLRLADWLPLG